MKNLKKLLAAFIAVTTVTAAFVIPASAETLTNANGTVTYTLPAGIQPYTGKTYQYNDYEFISYKYVDNNEQSAYITVGTLFKNNPGSMIEVAPSAEEKFVERLNNNAAQIGREHYNVQTRFEAINGIQFFVLEYDSPSSMGVGHNIDYFMTGFEFGYESYDSSLPHFDDFYSMLQSITFTPASTPSSGSTTTTTTTTTTSPDGSTTTTKTTKTTKTTTTTTTSSSDEIKIYVNGSRVYPDSAPVIINDRTLVPIRVVAEALGFRVDWDGVNRAVEVHNDEKSLYLRIDQSEFTRYFYNSYGDLSSMETLYADVPAQIINDRTYLPLRAVGEGLGATVNWDGNTRSVYISGGSVG